MRRFIGSVLTLAVVAFASLVAIASPFRHEATLDEKTTGQKINANAVVLKNDRKNQEAIPRDRDSKVFGKSVSITILNDDDKSNLVNEVSALDEIFLDIRVDEIGKWPKPRKAHIVVAIYDKPTSSNYKVGDLLTVHSDPDPVVVEPLQQKQIFRRMAFPFAKGDYIFRVFVSDLNELSKTAITHKSFPDEKFFPGNIECAITGVARVH